MAEKFVSLTQEKNEIVHHLPLTEGTMGPSVIDIRNLYAQTGYFT